uniref:Uncharacterized protein n=1 Tax=Anguilla anguilla TaxID=7936 RepID=A0A0E9XMN4_ANGAN
MRHRNRMCLTVSLRKSCILQQLDVPMGLV